MSERAKETEALRAALARLAQEDAPAVIAQARASARARAGALIEEALVEELLRAVAPRTPRQPPTPTTPAPPQPDSEPAGRPADAEALWAYCILGAAERDAAPAGAPGVQGEGALEVIEEDGLLALVSAVPLSEFSDERLREHLNDIEWVERVARAHEGVLERVLGRATILPLRLCTLYRDRAGVKRMLREQGPILREALSELEGRREWGAKVFVDQDRLTATHHAERPSPDTDPSPSGADYLARRQHERRSSERVQELGEEVVREIHARLEELAERARVNPLQRPELHGRQTPMLLNAAYLVSREREQEFEQVAQSLRERFSEDGFELELTGPWPPYNFISPAAMVTP